MDAALDDAEDRLIAGAVTVVPLEAAVEPAMGALGRAGGVVAVGAVGGALVEDEGDVGMQCGLDLHRGLRGEEALDPVAIGAEAHALLGDLEDRSLLVAAPSAALDLIGDVPVGEGEDLEPAGIGDQRPVPAHEGVQAPGSGDPLVAGLTKR